MKQITYGGKVNEKDLEYFMKHLKASIGFPKCWKFQQLMQIHKLMEKEGMAEQDANFIIGRLIDFYLEKHKGKTNKDNYNAKEHESYYP